MKELFTCLLLIFCLSSCEKDNETNCEIEEGIWNVVYVADISDGGYCSIYCDTPASSVPCTPSSIYDEYSGVCLTIKFNSNNTYTLTWTGQGYDVPDIDVLDYTQSGCDVGDMLILNSDTLIIMQIDNHNLTLQDSDYFRVVLNK